MGALAEAAKRQFGIEVSWTKEEIDGLTGQLLREELLDKIQKARQEKETQLGSDMARYLERMIMLQVVDSQWKDHLLAMDHLKEGIGLRGYGQKDPLIEYKREGLEMFEAMEARIASETVQFLMKVQVAMEAPAAETEEPLASRPLAPAGSAGRGRSRQTMAAGSLRPAAAPVMAPGGGKLGRNDPCPCGSGKKYKKCCGA